MEDNPIALTTPTPPVLESNVLEDATLQARKEGVSKNSGSNIDFNSQNPIDRVGSGYGAVSGYQIDKYLGATPYFADLQHRDAQAARSQSLGSALAKGLYQGVVGEVIGGTLEGVGALGMLATSEENFLYEMGQGIREGAEEDAFIFQQEPGKAFAFNDSGWWASNIPSLLSTLSMLIPGMGVGKVATLAGRGLAAAGRAGRVAKVRKAASNADEAAKIIKGMAGAEAKAATQAERTTNTIATAMGMRHAENIREAVDVSKQAEDDFLQADLDINEMQGTEAYRKFIASEKRKPRNKYELAKYVGGVAAKNAYSVNSANIVFDLAQTAMIFKPFKAVTRGAKATTAQAAEAAKKLGKKVVKESTGTGTTRFLDKIAPLKEFGLGMASEGAEEAVNFIGSEEGLSYAEELRGVERADFSERLSGYLADDHLWESAFWGAIGGGVFQAVGGAFGKKQNALLRSYEERIKTQEYFATEIKKAEESGDFKKAEQLKGQMITSLAVKAAQSGRVDSLLAQLNDDSYIEELAKTGLGTVEELVEKRAEIIQQVEQVEARYKEAVTWAEKNGMDSFAKGAYLNDSLRAHSIVAHSDSILSKLDELDKLGNEEQILAAKIQLLEEIKDLPKEERALYKDIVLEIMDEKAAYEKKNEGGVRTKAKDLNHDLQQRVTLEAMRRVAENQISNMKSDRARASYMERGEAARKTEFEKFKKRTIEEIAQENNKQRLEDIVKTAKRTKDSDLQKAAEARLQELQDEQKLDDELKNSDKPSDNTSEDPSNPNETTEEVEEVEEVEEPEETTTTPEEEDGQLNLFEPEEEPVPTKPEDPPTADLRKPLGDLEPLNGLLERITDEGVESQTYYIGWLENKIKELKSERNKVNKQKREAKKNNFENLEAQYLQQRNEITAEIKLLTTYLNSVKNLVVSDLMPPPSKEGKYSQEQIEQMQAAADLEQGTKIFLNELFGSFLKEMTANATQVHGLSFNEWRLKEGKSEIVLNEEDELKYEALQAALNGEAQAIEIEEVTEILTAEEERDLKDKNVDIYTGSGVKNLTELDNVRTNQEGQGKNKVTVTGKKYSTKSYGIFVTHKGTKILVGYVPQVMTLAKHVQRKNIFSTKGFDQRDNKDFDILYASLHVNGFQGIQSIDRLIRFRRNLETKVSKDNPSLSVKFHQGTDVNKKVRRGSLVRPGQNSTSKLIDIHLINESIDKHGVAVMTRQNGKIVLKNVENDTVIPGAMPYQDGLTFNKGHNMGFGLGSLYIPVPVDGKNTDNIMWVRVPKVSVKEMNTLDLIADATESGRAPEEITEELGNYMNTQFVNKKINLDDAGSLLSKSAKNYIKDGAIVDKSGAIFFVKDNKVVYIHRNNSEGLGLNFKSGISNIPSSFSFKDPISRSFFMNETLPTLLVKTPAPIAPVKSKNGEVLGYTHPLPALPQKDKSLNFPDTENTALVPELEMPSKDELNKDSEDNKDKPKEPNSTGSRKRKGRAAFLTIERGMSAPLNEVSTSEQQVEAEDWLKRNLPNVPFKRVKGIIKRGGINAYGIWEDGMIRVSDISVAGTEYHEAFHAVLDMYLDPARKERIFKEAEKKYGKLSRIELEEKLAESFREYMLSDGKTMQEKTGIRRLFSELAELVRSMFSGQYRARRLMQQINSGKFAQKPDSQTQNYVTKYLKVPTFKANELRELEELMPAVLNESLEAINQYIVAKISGENTQQVLQTFFNGDPSQEFSSLVSRIGDNILNRRKGEPNEDDLSELVSNKEIARDIIKLALIDDDYGGLESLFDLIKSETTNEDHLEKLEIGLNRIRDQREALINYLSERPSLTKALIGTLEIDVVTGTTDTQQYGKKSMAEIDPKEKIPAAVRNLIGRTLAMPVELTVDIAVAMETNDTAKLKEAVLKANQQNTYDSFSTFGLPRVLNFNHVYPYLLNELSDAVDYNEMIQRLNKLGAINPDMLMLVAKLEDPSTPDLIKNQFFNAFKRAKTDELNVTMQERISLVHGQPETIVTRVVSGVVSPAQLLANHNQSLLTSKLTSLSKKEVDSIKNQLAEFAALENWDTEKKKEFLKLIAKTGFTTLHAPALPATVFRNINNTNKDLAQTLYFAVDKLSQKSAETVNQGYRELEKAAKIVAPLDYGATSSGFSNGAQTLVYGHQLPSHLSEETDRLKNDKFRKQVSDEDTRLKSSSWLTDFHLWDSTSGNIFLKFGHFSGKPYTELDGSEFLLYSLEALYSFKKGSSGYIPIPTPSDADNSALIKTTWNRLGRGKKKLARLQQILDAEKTAGTPLFDGNVTTPEELMVKFALEAKELIKKYPKLAKRARSLLKKEAIRLQVTNLSKEELETDPIKYEQAILNLVTDMVAATFESHWNVVSWVSAPIHEFGNSTVKFQKRMKQILSPGTPSFLTDINETFKSVTYAEPMTSVEGYDEPVQRTDAQTYVTLEHYRNILKTHGKLTPAMEVAIEKAIKKEPLTRGERSLLRPYKPFYFGRVALKGQRKGVQIKNMIYPLVPAHLDSPQASELKKMYEWMKANNIDQVQPPSAQKIGVVENPINLWDGATNKFNSEAIYVESDHAQDLPMRHYRQQVQINDHMMNSDTIGWGTQTSKIITSGLTNRDSLEVNGQTMTGKQIVSTLLKKEEKLLQTHVKELHADLFTGKDLDMDKVRKYLLDHLGDDADPTIVELLNSKKSLNNPIHKAKIALTLLSSLQKEHKRLQVPGGTQVQVSDLGINNGIDDSLQGMRLSKDKKTVLPAEVVTSRNFLPKKYQGMSIEEIRKVDPKALQMIVYRVPSESKNSMAVVEVVEFLPDGQDGMIVPADFVVQMGSDFDVDKLFVNWKSDRKGARAEIWNEYFELNKGILLNPTIFVEEVRKAQGFKTFQELAKKTKDTVPSRQLTAGNGTIDTHVRDNPYSLLSHVSMHQDNMAGISLKGIAAKANTFWIQVDRFELTLKFDEQVGSITGINPKLVNMERRGINAEAVAASMDGAKDPVYGYLGLDQTNWTFFNDLYMLGLSFEEAIEIASNPYIKSLLEHTKNVKFNEARDGKALAYYKAYKKEWMPALMSLKKLMRVPESKLDTMTEAINIVDDEFNGKNQDTINLLKKISHNQGDLSIFDLPSIKGHLDITRLTRKVLLGLGIDYFGMSNTSDLTFFDYNRHQTLKASESYLKNRVASYTRMGKIQEDVSDTVAETRAKKKADSSNLSDWNIKDFLSYFQTQEGLDLLKEDPNLAHVLSHIVLKEDYVQRKNGKKFHYINIKTHNLRDPEVASDFMDAWEALAESKSLISQEFGNALVEYEAERSGWRYGSDTLTSFIPGRVVNNVVNTADASGSNSRITKALDPRVPFAKNENQAILSNKTLKLLSNNGSVEVYITLYDIDGLPMRSKVALPNLVSMRGFKPDLSSNENETGSQALSKQWHANKTAVTNLRKRKTAQLNKKSNKRNSKLGTGTEQNYDSRKKELQSKFAGAGIKVSVETDSSIEGAGEVVWDGNTGAIKIHPTRLGGDTIIHEFAHIYVELLGYEHPLVQQAIAELRGSELYKQVKGMYPELSLRELELEVLVTAMGKKGDLIFEKVQNQSKFKTLVNKIIRAIGKLLGVSQDTALILAENMIQGVELNHNNTQKFKAQQRISKRIDEIKMQEEFVRELNERISEMKILGMTSNEEQAIFNDLLQSSARVRGINAEEDKSGVIAAVIDSANDVLEKSDAFLTESNTYLNASSRVAEFNESDTAFFNSLRQLKQILSTLDQVTEAFVETGPSENLRKFKALKDRVPFVLKEIRRVEKQAISNKLKANSANVKLTNVEENLFDLATHIELNEFMRESNTATAQLQGLGEQDAVVLQLLHKQINRVIEGFEMEAKNDIEELNNIMDELGDTPIESILDESGKSFVSPLKDQYWQERSDAFNQGLNIELWDAENNHMPYVVEYYQWKLKKEDPEEKALRTRKLVLDEIQQKRGLSEEERLQRIGILKDLETLQQRNNKFWTFMEANIDQKGFDAAYAKAKNTSPEAFKKFNEEHPSAMTIGGGRKPMRDSSFHKGWKVKDKYKNPEWKEGDSIVPLPRFNNPKYDKLTELERNSILRLKKLMSKRLPKDSSFVRQSLIPQVAENPKYDSFKDRIAAGLKVEGREAQVRLDAEGRMVPVNPFLDILKRDPEKNISTDLRQTIAELINQTSSAHARRVLSSLMLATRDQLADAELVEPNKGISISGFASKKTKTNKLTRGERSKAMEVLEHNLEGYLGAGWTDKTKNDKIVKKFLTYQSFMGIGLNPSAWINNVMYGSLQQRLETLGGAQWDKSQMKKARKIVYNNLINLITARKKGGIANNRETAILTWFDVTMDQRELPDTADQLNKLFDSAYFGQTYGEIVMQSQVAVAMMMNTTIVLADGTETNLFDSLEWNGKQSVNFPKGALLKRADGQLVPLTLQEIGAQKSKMRAVLQRIHGAYNQEDIGMWHRKSVGQVVMQFRKWIPQSIKRRFGRDQFSETRETNEIGYYKALFSEIVAKGFRRDGKYLQFLATFKEHPPHIQEAALKGLYELMGGAIVAATSTLLGALVEIDDDDDEYLLFDDDFYKAKALYHLDRVGLELNQYTPWGIYDFLQKLGKDPAAGYRTATNAFKLANELAYTSLHFEMREYEGGRHYGDAKIPIYLQKLLPFYKQIGRELDSIETTQAYSLTS